MQNFRFRCQKCRHEFLRRMNVEDFDKQQYTTGFSCFDCGFPKMIVGRTMAKVQDGFKAGWQSNIRAYCDTYSQYKAILKERGLEEIGNEEFKKTEYKTQYFDKDMMEKLVKQGVSFTGQEIEALENGKMQHLGIY
jgi:DNA-directed RNA polymerase subunit RPC12/RpoP